MWYESWIEGIDGLASLYSFDIMADGSYSEIRLMAVNKKNESMLHMNPDAPEFYPGIPYRNYWVDINFESFVYKCANSSEPMYAYVNARGTWLKCFFIPVVEPDAGNDNNSSGADKNNNDNGNVIRTVYCLYMITYSDDVETDAMSQKSSEVSRAVMNISIKIHETPDFYQAMSSAIKEIKAFCVADRCSLYTVDKNSRKCCFISENGVMNECLYKLGAEMNRTPYEVALAWEKDLALSDCLILEDLTVIEERDPLWYQSLIQHEIYNIVLYAIRYKQNLIGFIWAANFDTSKMLQIKETLELTAFLIAAVIVNHQLVSRLEFKSTVDGLTQVGNRYAMNDKVDMLVSRGGGLPSVLGVVFVDLNGLKTVNDDEGHDAGDKMLIRAASLLKDTFEDYEIYRAGGDEFVIFCPNITERDMEQRISQLFELSERVYDVSFAIGTAYCEGDYDIFSAMKLADENMYRNKEEYYRSHPEKERRSLQPKKTDG